MKNALSFIAASIIGILCVAPPEVYNHASNISAALGATYPIFKGDYVISLMVNSFLWMFLVVISGLYCFFLLTKKLDILLKMFLVYILIVGCFFSQVPSFSFNAFICVVIAAYFFYFLQKIDFKILLDMLQAVFWLELTFATLHFFGKDTLMNFAQPEPVFFGTVFQHMRFASLLCILSPFLLVRSRWYLIPICAAVILTKSSGFALSIGTGVLIYVLLSAPRNKWWILSGVGIVVLIGCYLGRDSWRVAFVEGRIPIWMICIKSWIFDTRVNPHGMPDIFGIAQSGPFSLKCFLFGHGLDTFYPLFPVYKSDPNPFPQVHNSWIQLPWELGLSGFLIFVSYCTGLIIRLYKNHQNIIICGCSIIAVNLFVHFPDRQTQTMGLLIAWFAFCEVRARRWVELTT